MKLFSQKNKKILWNRGMTYVELIVVLAIFGTMSSILLFKYGDFEKQIDIQNTVQDIALQIVTAQKSAVSGKIPNAEGLASHIVNNLVNPSYNPSDLSQTPWKPAYGVYFNVSSPTQFIYFLDSSLNDGLYDINCQLSADTECLKKINLEKGNMITDICVFNTPLSTSCDSNTKTISIVFTRPNTSAFMYDYDNASPVGYKTQITISNAEGRLKKTISVFTSGKIEVN
ncbi:MAG: type II secretion system protein [Patescibacteria group bacterium]